MSYIGKKPFWLGAGALLLGGAAFYLSKQSGNRDHQQYIPRKYPENDFSHSAFFINGNENPLSRPKLGIGLSGGGRKLTAHVGALEYLERHLLQDGGPIPFELITKSAGSISGALYIVNLQKFLENPGVFNGRSPSEELERIVAVNQDIFEPNFLNLLRQQGAINVSRVNEFLRRAFEDRNFHDVPNLYVVAHRANSTEDVVFGDVEKNAPIWVAVRGSIAYNPHIPGIDYKGAYIEDGGFMRASPLNELYSHGYLDRRIVVHLGLRTLYRAPDDLIGIGRFQPFAYIRDLERRGSTHEHDREVRDFSEDLTRETGRTIDDVLGGMQGDLIVIAPELPFTSFFKSGLPLDFIPISYLSAMKAVETHAKLNPIIEQKGSRRVLNFARNV